MSHLPPLRQPAWRLAAALAATLLGAHAAHATHAAPSAALSAMEQAVLAEQLTSHALQQGDVVTLIVAARLKMRSAGRPTARQPLPPVRTASDTAAASKPAVHPRSAAALLARARELAQGRPELLALIEDAASERPRGTENGPQTHSRVAGARGADVYREVFKPNEPAIVLIAGDGDSNLDLYVFDERGTRVCAAERLDDVEVCRWQPQGAGPYSIHVVNRGTAENQYVMRSN